MKSPTFAPAYVAFFPALAEIAQAHGYALTIHGSVSRDFDLLAVPWTEEAGSAEALMEALRAYAGAWMGAEFGPESVLKGPEQKPHGRVSWAIQIGSSAYLDLSVMPRRSAA